MQKKIIKLLLLIGIMVPITCSGAHSLDTTNGPHPILINGTNVQGIPRDSSIEATINGHVLVVVFLDDLGQVAVEVSEVGGGETHATSIHTPNGVNFNIPDTGSYIVTFTLPDGDVYYGEFEVTD